jgi:hypothetical protein
MVRPTDREKGRGRLAGLQGLVGWSGRSGDDGAVAMYALPAGEAHEASVKASGYEEAVAKDVYPTVGDAPAEIPVRLRRKPSCDAHRPRGPCRRRGRPVRAPKARMGGLDP